MAKCKRWKETDINYLKSNWGKKPIEELAEDLGRTKKAVYQYAYKYGMIASGVREENADIKLLDLPPLQPVTRSWAETTAELRELLGV
jgi:hypothetical protein